MLVLEERTIIHRSDEGVSFLDDIDGSNKVANVVTDKWH